MLRFAFDNTPPFAVQIEEGRPERLAGELPLVLGAWTFDLVLTGCSSERTIFFSAYSLCAAGGRAPTRLRRLLDVFDDCRGLDFSGNPWVEPPESIVRKGLKDAREYFQDLYAESYRAQRNSVKIILVGQEGAGKTR